MHQGKFRLDVSKWFFTERMAGHCNRLLREHRDCQSSRSIRMTLLVI